jgi:cytoskeletal protein CcmA (bactofilin family)
VAAGGSLLLNSPVTDDLVAAGGSLMVNAPVGDDLRIAGGELTISSSVGGDLVAGGGNVTIPAGAVVAGDVIIGAGNLHLGGTVRGDLLVYAGTVNLTGTIQGDATLYVSERITISGRIQGDTVFTGPEANLGPAARFDGDVSYWVEEGEIDFGQVTVGGQVLFDPELKGKMDRYTRPDDEGWMAGGMTGLFFATLLSGMVVIALSVVLLKGTFRLAGETLNGSYLQSTGVGLLACLLLPVIAALAFITVLGIPVGMVLMTLFIFSLLFGRAVAAMTFAAGLERRRGAQWSTGRLVLVSIGIYAGLKMVSVIPLIGWVAVLLAVLAGYGSLLLGIWNRRKTAAPTLDPGVLEKAEQETGDR